MGFSKKGSGGTLTTKGDLLSRSSSSDGRLAVGTDAQVLIADAASTLGVKWATASSGGIHARATLANVAEFTTSSTTYVDVTNYTLNVVTTVTCTIIAIAVMTAKTAATSADVLLVVNGVSTNPCRTTSSASVPLTVVGYQTGVTAGTITCKIQAKSASASSTTISENTAGGHMIILALAE